MTQKVNNNTEDLMCSLLTATHMSVKFVERDEGQRGQTTLTLLKGSQAIFCLSLVYAHMFRVLDGMD